MESGFPCAMGVEGEKKWKKQAQFYCTIAQQRHHCALEITQRNDVSILLFDLTPIAQQNHASIVQLSSFITES